MVNYIVKYDPKVFNDFAKQVAIAPTTLNIYAATTIRKSVEAYVVRELVTRNISKPTYKLTWRSEKQRKKVMAKLRKAGNLPYKRTGELQKGWKVTAVRDKTSSIIAVNHDSPVIEYVAGSSNLRQPMFPQWYHYEDVLLKAEDMASDMAVNAWFDIVEYGEVQAGSLRIKG